MNISKLRHDYSKHELDVSSAGEQPILLFDRWFREALATGQVDPNAMTLATSDKNGQPAARILLLKGYSEKGFLFFTNYEGRKARELKANPCAALLFYWPQHERQVRVEGAVQKIAPEESDAYFNERPLNSQVSACISPQSKVIASRDELLNMRKDFLIEQEGHELKRPEYWGGYLLKADVIEFWQGRPGRLHDRIRFRWHNENWLKERLAP